MKTKLLTPTIIGLLLCSLTQAAVTNGSFSSGAFFPLDIPGWTVNDNAATDGVAYNDWYGRTAAGSVTLNMFGLLNPNNQDESTSSITQTFFVEAQASFLDLYFIPAEPAPPAGETDRFVLSLSSASGTSVSDVLWSSDTAETVGANVTLGTPDADGWSQVRVSLEPWRLDSAFDNYLTLALALNSELNDNIDSAVTIDDVALVEAVIPAPGALMLGGVAIGLIAGFKRRFEKS